MKTLSLYPADINIGDALLIALISIVMSIKEVKDRV